MEADLEPKDFTALLAAVAAGEGVALCPRSMQAMSRTGVVYRPLAPALAPALAIDVQVAWRTRETRPAVLGKVAMVHAHGRGPWPRTTLNVQGFHAGSIVPRAVDLARRGGLVKLRQVRCGQVDLQRAEVFLQIA